MNGENDNNEHISKIIQNADGKFSASMPIARYFGRKRRKNIESQTKTTIKMPKSDLKIEVTGSSCSDVVLAMKEVEKTIEQTNRRLTHFLSIPINDTGIVERFVEFKDGVNQMDSTNNFMDEHFQKTFKLHLTLGVLTLDNDEKRNSALEALQQCRDIVDNAKTRFNVPGDLQIKVCGVQFMNGDLSKCNVVYGMVDSELLQTIANEIVAHFISKGLIESDKNQVILHVTMINVAFVIRITKNRKEKIDATAILEKYSNYDFGVQTIDEIHLSRFERTGESNYYSPEGILNISNGNAIVP